MHISISTPHKYYHTLSAVRVPEFLSTKKILCANLFEPKMCHARFATSNQPPPHTKKSMSTQKEPAVGEVWL